MMSRIRDHRHRNDREFANDRGFTLVEILIAMMIIGILAAVAIPVFINQRKKAKDAAVRADIETVGKEIATHYVNNTTAPTVTIVNNRYMIDGKDVGARSDGVELVSVNATSYSNWCVCLENLEGMTKVFNYSASKGLAEGAC